MELRPAHLTDAAIGKAILSHAEEEAISADGGWEILYHLGDLSAGLLGWYPFPEGCRVLQPFAGFGALTRGLLPVCGHVTAAEQDPYRRLCLKERFRTAENLTVTDDWCAGDDIYDLIVCAPENRLGNLCSLSDWRAAVAAMRKHLTPGGRLLLCVPNRFGLQYLCGETDPVTGLAFEGLDDERGSSFRFDRRSLLELLRESFPSVKLYYVFPDHETPQLIYTDEYPPAGDLHTRARIYVRSGDRRFIDEKKLLGALEQNGEALFFANSFLAECGEDSSDVAYAVLSSYRPPRHAFATTIHGRTVTKTPFHPDGWESLRELVQHTEELTGRGVPVLPLEITGNGVTMARVNAPTLSEWLKDRITSGRVSAEMLKEICNRLYAYIMSSSEHVPAEQNVLLSLMPEADHGPILKKAYLEMIPVNCFWQAETPLFFDQEFTKENIPARFVLFRGLRDLYDFVPEVETLVPLADMKELYGLTDLWEPYWQEERRFWKDLGHGGLYSAFGRQHTQKLSDIKMNRRLLRMSREKEVYRFAPLHGLEGRRLVVFGAGRVAEHFLMKYGAKYPPLFIVDNDPEKWGTEKCGFPVKRPAELQKLVAGTFRVVIAVASYREIEKQLREMGLADYEYSIFDRKLDAHSMGTEAETMSDGKYNVGYTTGVFDLFHIGHLNILRRSKERCHYLIVGVLNDEICEKEKGKRPFIPFAERFEIVKQCKYVDRAIEIDAHNTEKLDAWQELRFGCLFAGGDHATQSYWLKLQRSLRTLGSDLEFFPYTEGTSSTQLQQALAALQE